VPPAAAATRLAVALDRLRADGAVEAAGLASFRPFAGMEEFRVGPRDGSVSASWVKGGRVSGGWFAAAGVPVRAGRAFDERDVAAAPAVAIVNETLARRLGAGAAVVGARVRVDSTLDAEIVGVVADVAPRVGEREQPAIYLPAAQGELTAATLYVRARRDVEPAAEALRQAAAALDPRLPAPEAHTADELLRRELGPWSMIVAGTGFFGLIALLLAASGVYAVTAYLVAMRTHEIGVRVALGAGSRDVVALVLRQALRLALAGVAVGVPLALGVAVAMRSMLYGISPADPLTFAGISAVLVLVALLASVVPARRAAGVQAAVALRAD
jgi:hypothetical protein